LTEDGLNGVLSLSVLDNVGGVFINEPEIVPSPSGKDPVNRV